MNQAAPGSQVVLFVHEVARYVTSMEVNPKAKVGMGVTSAGTSLWMASQTGDLGTEKRHIQWTEHAIIRYVCCWKVLREMHAYGRGANSALFPLINIHLESNNNS